MAIPPDADMIESGRERRREFLVTISSSTELRSPVCKRKLRSNVDPQLFDLAVQAGEAELQAFGGFAFVGPLAEHAGDVQLFVVPQRRSQVVCVGERLS